MPWDSKKKKKKKESSHQARAACKIWCFKRACMSVSPDITLCGWLGSKHQLSVWQTHVVPCYIAPQTPKGKTRMELPSVAFKARCLLLGWNQGHEFWLKSGKCQRCEPSPSMQITVSQMWPPFYANHSGCHRCDLPSMQITVGIKLFPDKLSFLTNYVKNDENSQLTAVFWNKIFLCPCRWSVLMSTVACAVTTCSTGEKSLFPLRTPPPHPTPTHTNECYNSRVVLLYGGQTHISILWFWSGDFIIIHKPLAWQYKVKK